MKGLLRKEVRKIEEMTTAELNQYLENIAKLIEANAQDAETAAQIVRDSKVTAQKKKRSLFQKHRFKPLRQVGSLTLTAFQ